jgi:hypothetical protein
MPAFSIELLNIGKVMDLTNLWRETESAGSWAFWHLGLSDSSDQNAIGSVRFVNSLTNI